MRINEVDNQLTQTELDQLELFADRMFGKVGIDVEFTKHFLDRVNDERNVKQITASELTRLFKQEFKRYGKPIAQLGPDAEAVMKDMQTNINMPFVLRWDPQNKELDLIAKTVMRKKDFRTSNPEFAVENKKFTIVEGGAMPGVGVIHIDEIQPTLAALQKVLGVDLQNNTLGSVGKREFSGDIDVALQISREDIPEFLEKLKRTPEIKDIAQSSVIMTKVEIQNYDKEKTEKSNRPRTGFVQVDFMPGDPSWLKTYYHSPNEKDSKYKGVFRNLLIAEIAMVYDRQDTVDTIPDGRPVRSVRWMWSPTEGLIKVVRTPVPKQSGDGYTKKNQNKIISGPFKNPDDIAKNMGLNSAEDLYSFETLLDAIKKHYGPDLIKKILAGFTNNRTVQDIGIPSEIQ